MPFWFAWFHHLPKCPCTATMSKAYYWHVTPPCPPPFPLSPHRQVFLFILHPYDVGDFLWLDRDQVQVSARGEGNLEGSLTLKRAAGGGWQAHEGRGPLQGGRGTQ